MNTSRLILLLMIIINTIAIFFIYKAGGINIAMNSGISENIAVLTVFLSIGVYTPYLLWFFPQIMQTKK